MNAATKAAPARLEIDCTDRGYCPGESDLLEGSHEVDRSVCDGELFARVRRAVRAGHVVPVLGAGGSLERVVATCGPDRQERLVTRRSAELAGVFPLIRS